MALSKPLYPITEFDEAKHCTKHYEFEEDYEDVEALNLDIETCLRLHRVRSFTVTREEFQQIAMVALGKETDLMTLSCRIRQTLRYFVQDISDKRCHIFCRNSFGICATKMALIDRLLSEKYGKERDEYRQMVDFIRHLFDICDVEDDIKILQDSFRIPKCEEHEECRKVGKLLRFKKIDEDNGGGMNFYSTCCDKPECTDFTRQLNIVRTKKSGELKRCEIRMKIK